MAVNSDSMTIVRMRIFLLLMATRILLAERIVAMTQVQRVVFSRQTFVAFWNRFAQTPSEMISAFAGKSHVRSGEYPFAAAPNLQRSTQIKAKQPPKPHVDESPPSRHRKM
jgi:hypothetical protein